VSRSITTDERATDADAQPLAVQRRQLWGLAYRFTGCAAEADDIVQETLTRWLERGPDGGERPSGPWMVRVATNLAIDVLRARRRRAYAGPWLPSPVVDEDGWLDAIHAPDADAEARYGRVESITIAFLTALEALGPRQRATLILREVLGYSPAEIAAVLETTEGNVRVLHLRARRAMASYDRTRCIPTATLRERHRAVLEQFLGCLAAQDVAGLERLLAASVRTATDSAGKYSALQAPLAGRGAVARFYVRAAANRAPGGPAVRILDVNGLPAAIVTLARPVRRQAPFLVITLGLDDRGAIGAIHTILAPGKLTALRDAEKICTAT
jgi:RNA polymerase sigma-70 factor (ECF subfamily)